MTSQHLTKLLEPYGVASESVVDLTGDPKPTTIRYLDLQSQSTTLQPRPDAIVEAQREPLAYVVDGTRHTDGFDLPSLNKKLALRGDAPYLAIVEPGRLTLYDLALGEDAPVLREELLKTQDRARTAFYRLHVDPSPSASHRRFVHDVLFELLTGSVDGLQKAGIDRDDAISLVGRALFVRFLLDRKVLTEQQVRKIWPDLDNVENLFSNPRSTEATCRWLNRTFNGDFLPLSFWPDGEGFSECRQEVFGLLSDIMHRAPGGQKRFDWGDLDFAHIPVGLLSQVYEWQAERWDPTGQRTDSIYYTPRRIAEYMVREIFSGLAEQGPVPPHRARILDPAVGGAVFLVAAFEEIAAAWWRCRERPPETHELRSILYEQLTGFDVGEPALRLAALSLYLKAIELDLNPHPVEKLSFKPLRGCVLHNVRETKEREARYVLGSLGPKVDESHQAAYDAVVGNPPWTTLGGQEGREVHDAMVEAVRPLIQERLGEKRAKEFHIPDRVPDLLFVWRAMEWAKPDGWIAFAVHGRVLLKTSDSGTSARKDLFEALTVTGVLNGADLRKTQVWPRVTAPFALLFAKNAPPPAGHAFRFVSPYVETGVNEEGRLRIDSKAAQPVSLARLLERQDLLKSLFRGTALDVDVLEKIRARDWPTLVDCWNQEDLAHGKGYIVAASQRQFDAAFLKGLPNAEVSSIQDRFLLQPSKLPKFTRSTLNRPRDPSIYRGPLLLVRKSPPADRERGRALLCYEDIAYNQSFYGFSAHKHFCPKSLAKMLALVLHSELFIWHSLMTSGEFGVERDSLQKLDIERLPFPPLKDLALELQEEVSEIFEEMVTGGAGCWEALDDWVAKLYGLDRWDQEVIQDTLSVSLPFGISQARAQQHPTVAEVEAFVNRLQQELQPAAEAVGRSLIARRLQRYEGSPWEILAIEAQSHAQEEPSESTLLELLADADQVGASQLLVIQRSQRRILVAILCQYRYWTQSRARLCALEILQHHLEDLTWAT